MNKIEVKLCMGTACYILGGADLLLLESKLPDDFKDKVVIKGVSCLEYCKDEEAGKPPFVQVNDELICEATITKVIDAIKSI